MALRQKYSSKTVTVDNLVFHSKLEAKRWGELQLLQRAGIISDLQRQVVFPLEVNGERVCKYIADFTYLEDGKYVVADAKGFLTPEFRLKAKLFKAIHGYEITLLR